MTASFRPMGCACLLALLGCSRDLPTPATTAQAAEPEVSVAAIVATLKNAKLDTDGQIQRVVANATASQRAIVFVHVDWAPMEPQRTRYVEFMLAYQAKHPQEPVMFHYVDFTRDSGHYQPLAALPGWNEGGDRGYSLIHGCGELVWMKQGRVLHVESILQFDSSAKLIEQTESLLLGERQRDEWSS